MRSLDLPPAAPFPPAVRGSAPPTLSPGLGPPQPAFSLPQRSAPSSSSSAVAAAAAAAGVGGTLPHGRASTPAHGQGKPPGTPATSQRPRAFDISWGVGDGRGDGSGMEAKGAAAYLGALDSEGPPASSGMSSAGRRQGTTLASRGQGGPGDPAGPLRQPQLQRNAPRRSKSVGGRPVTRWSGTGPAGPPALLGARPAPLHERRMGAQVPLPAVDASSTSRGEEAGITSVAQLASPTEHTRDVSGTSGPRPRGRPPAHPDRQGAQKRQPTPPQSAADADVVPAPAQRVGQSPLTRSQSFIVSPTTAARAESRPPVREQRLPEPPVSLEQIADLSKLLSVNRFDLQPGAKRIP